MIKANSEMVKRLFRFEDHRPKKTNKLLVKAINIKVPILSLFSDLKNAGMRFYFKELLEQTLIPIKAREVG